MPATLEQKPTFISRRQPSPVFLLFLSCVYIEKGVQLWYPSKQLAPKCDEFSLLLVMGNKIEIMIRLCH